MRVWSSRELLKILHQDGWYIKRQRGSHIQLVHKIKIGKVTVPHPRNQLDPKTVKNIIKQAGIKFKEN